MNPGTMIGDASTTTQEDISLRRLRILAYAQISPRYMIVTHFGINNQTFTNGGAAGTSGTGGYGAGKKPGLFFTMLGMSMLLYFQKKESHLVYQ